MNSSLSFFDMVNNCKGDPKSAFRFTDKMDISYDTFYNDCCEMQNRIMNCNGNFIGICLKPSYYWIVAYFGVQLSGKTAVLIDESKEETEINYICKRYSVSELITAENIEIHSNRINTSLKKVTDNTEISTIIFTSGTEGIAKGVALSAKGILTSTYDSLNTIEINKDDVIIHTLPFFHGFGMAAEVVATIMKKTTLCFGKSLGSLPNDIAYFSATILFCVPQIAKGIAPYLSNNESLKKIVLGSAGIDSSVVNYLQGMGITVHRTYGLSECSPVVAVSYAKDEQKDFYAGRVLPCCRVNTDVDGEICVMGENLMLGYFDGQNLEYQRKDKFFRTGDIGYLDGDKLYVTGRKKGILVFSNGEKIGLNTLEDIVSEKCNFIDCFIFSENDRKISIIVYSHNNTVISKKEIQDCMPIGVSVVNFYRRETPLIINKLNKKVRNVKIQIKNAYLI